MSPRTGWRAVPVDVLHGHTVGEHAARSREAVLVVDAEVGVALVDLSRKLDLRQIFVHVRVQIHPPVAILASI